MKIPLTKYGWPQVAIFPAVLSVIMAIYLLVGIMFLSAWAIILVELVLAILLIWILSFFRDPYRIPPSDTSLLLAPADGRITDIEIILVPVPLVAQKTRVQVKENDSIGGTAIRIGIFLSIFNVHINRSPCNAKVEKISYRQGNHKNAANPRSGRVNESNEVCLVRTNSPNDRLIVRQISGSIARRIVCQISCGQKLTSGEKFGMIKFGSRTEIFVPLSPKSREYLWQPKCMVRVGDKVKAGLTPVVKYEIQKLL
jgi:phosphatidylserine decarboxylase